MSPDSILKRRVIIFEPWGRQGQAHYVHSLCQELTNFCELILVTGNHFELKDTSKLYNVKYLANGIWYSKNSKTIRAIKLINYLIFNTRFIFFIRKFKPDVVHYQFLVFPYLDNVFLKVYRWLFPKTIFVFTSHDVEALSGKKYVNWKYSECLRKFDKHIAHSEYGATYLEVQYGLQKSKIEIIPHGRYSYMLDRWPLINKQNIREKLNLKSNFVLVLLGSILEYKGPDIAIRLIASLYKDEGVDVSLIIAGSSRGVNIKHLSDLVSELDIQSRVRIINSVLSFQELSNYISCADAGLLPYRKITTPGVGIMLQTYGLPLFCSNIGGFNNLVINNLNGVFIDINDLPGSSKRIKSVLSMEGELDRMSNESNKLMSSRYNWRDIALSTNLFYDKPL